jgi:two-component system, chemotaxis family, CheB/CheR fusion protein
MPHLTLPFGAMMTNQADQQQTRVQVVGIGASAGGLQAFTDFISHLPTDSGLAFVLVQHLDPQQPSLLAELLATHTSMPVLPVVDQTTPAPDHIYLIPPNTALTITNGVLHLEPPTQAHGQRLPIDTFFLSLAADQGAQAIGIVLSGTGRDGTLGLAAIKEHGGFTLAQRPSNAEYPAMPQNAITYGVVDEVLDVAAMPARLLARTNSVEQPPRPGAPANHTSADTLRMITTILYHATGHDFSHYKPATLLRRIDRRRQLLRLKSLEDYYAHLQEHQGEATLLFQDLLISVTGFFRDPEAFEALGAIIPDIVRKQQQHRRPLRVWAPGCASGEEAYSLAILLTEQLAQFNPIPPVQIFATDIDEAALVAARRGYYDANIAHQVTPERLARYFIADGDGYQINKTIRELCLFSAHNLISDPPFGRMDLIVCRNLLIYFDTDLQRRLIPVLHYALAPDGYLFLGSAESINEATDLFRVVDAKHRIYQRQERLTRTQIDLPWTRGNRQPVDHARPAYQPPQPGAPTLGATLERILLRDYTPTAAIIDAGGEIMHLTGRTPPYLGVPAGAPTTNLLAMVHPDLHTPLRAAIRAATHEQIQVVREELTLTTPAGLQRMMLTVQPLNEPAIPAGQLLVVMQTLGAPTPLIALDQAPEAATQPAALLLQELQRTRDTLETTIRDLQEANLDLTAANEELRSLNEEFQAANEELQTSKEEIQSINEELQTVNSELSHKISELDRANADLANLFASTAIPAIFLHADGTIARFTPHATELFALINADIGRPITDFRARFSSTHDIWAQIAQVLASLTPRELIVQQAEQDRWWNLLIRPYRTLANTVDGVVLTFIDITTLKRADNLLQQAHDKLEQRVQERTSDLDLVNTTLQGRIAEIARSEKARQQLLRQLVTAQEEERRQIARELHDQMGQELTALILGLKTLENGITDQEGAIARIRQLQALAVQIGEEVRDLAVQLRPSALDDMGLVLALTNFVEQWSVRAKVAVDLHTSGIEAEQLPLAVETTIYRLVQEALTNVQRHAEASEVSIIIEGQGDEVRLIIEDDGIGFTVAPTNNRAPDVPPLGLIGMHERVALLGGTLTIETAPGSGTTLFARLPLPTTETS